MLRNATILFIYFILSSFHVFYLDFIFLKSKLLLKRIDTNVLKYEKRLEIH